MKKMSRKCSTHQRFIRKRNTTYKIGTLELEKKDIFCASAHLRHSALLICTANFLSTIQRFSQNQQWARTTEKKDIFCATAHLRHSAYNKKKKFPLLNFTRFEKQFAVKVDQFLFQMFMVHRNQRLPLVGKNKFLWKKVNKSNPAISHRRFQFTCRMSWSWCEQCPQKQLQSGIKNMLYVRKIQTAFYKNVPKQNSNNKSKQQLPKKMFIIHPITGQLGNQDRNTALS